MIGYSHKSFLIIHRVETMVCICNFLRMTTPTIIHDTTHHFKGISAENEAILRNKTVWFIEDLAQKLEGAER